ncbi:uncharacterized protein LOC134324282 isoform X2 [Trichomycterus rosablanca]|uniref:uncharacterized protein LOC134324282 isoform X2 n=1 Tax=Trichomycterus rosablanca TaxID=2290929 RepID=UPI002F35BA28
MEACATVNEDTSNSLEQNTNVEQQNEEIPKTTVKEEVPDLCGGTSSCLANISPMDQQNEEILKVMVKKEESEDDSFLYCEECRSFFISECQVHGLPLFIPDNPVLMGVTDRAKQTIPPGLEARESNIPDTGLGVFNKGETVPVGAHFGPYEGELVEQEEAMNSGYSWVIYKSGNFEKYIDAKKETHSNWMRFVNCARNNEEQNLVAFQFQGSVFYRCCRPIEPGQELLVWYEEEYARGVTFDYLWKKKCSANVSHQSITHSSAMEQLLFILIVTGVVQVVLSVPRKYYLIQQGKTWTDALTYCRTYHNDLATFESNADLVKLQSVAQEQQFTSNAWIGLYDDINSWRWSMGNEPLGTETMWEPGQPDNGNGDQSCVLTTFATWYDAPCSLPRRFACIDGNKTGNDRFVSYTTSVTWFEAQSYCRQFHTDLVTIRDSNEASYINILSQGWGVWIGLFRDTWKWSNQTNFTTIPWATGEPNNGMGHEDCGFINNALAGDAQCSLVQPFFCFGVITGQIQIIRLKIQSDQNMNDPALLAAILDKIHQMLGYKFSTLWQQFGESNILILARRPSATFGQ